MTLVLIHVKCHVYAFCWVCELPFEQTNDTITQEEERRGGGGGKEGLWDVFCDLHKTALVF